MSFSGDPKGTAERRDGGAQELWRKWIGTLVSRQKVSGPSKSTWHVLDQTVSEREESRDIVQFMSADRWR